MSSPTEWIRDSYITPWALPNERIVAYIKWDANLPVQSVRIRTEADVMIHRMLNIGDEAWKAYDFRSGKLDIAKKDMQIPGFIGFESHYFATPQTEKELTFVVDFKFEDGPERHVSLTTEILRPILEVQLMTEEIASTRENPFPKPVRFKLVQKGRGDVLQGSLMPTIQAIGGTGLKIKIDTADISREDQGLLFVQSNTAKQATISISGQGLGMIVMGFTYRDRRGNTYSTSLAQIVVNIEERQSVKVPISNEVDTGRPQLVLEPISAA